MLCMDVYHVYNQFGGNEFVEVMESKSSQLVLLHVYCCMRVLLMTSFQSMGHCFNKLFP